MRLRRFDFSKKCKPVALHIQHRAKRLDLTRHRVHLSRERVSCLTVSPRSVRWFLSHKDERSGAMSIKLFHSARAGNPSDSKRRFRGEQRTL
jgi:hypothetical protein